MSDAFHSKARYNELKSFSWKCFSEDISQLKLCPNKVEFRNPTFYLFSDEMVSNIDVLRSGVLNVVATKSNGTFIVTVHRDLVVIKAIVR